MSTITEILSVKGDRKIYRTIYLDGARIIIALAINFQKKVLDEKPL